MAGSKHARGVSRTPRECSTEAYRRRLIRDYGSDIFGERLLPQMELAAARAFFAAFASPLVLFASAASLITWSGTAAAGPSPEVGALSREEAPTWEEALAASALTWVTPATGPVPEVGAISHEGALTLGTASAGLVASISPMCMGW